MLSFPFTSTGTPTICLSRRSSWSTSQKLFFAILVNIGFFYLSELLVGWVLSFFMMRWCNSGLWWHWPLFILLLFFLEFFVQLVVPFFKPISVGFLILFFRHWLKEAMTKFVTGSCKVGVSLNVIEFETFIQFSIANWTKVKRVCIGLFQVIGTLHETLIPCAMTHSKHMSKFMSTNLDHSQKGPAVSFFVAGEIFSCKIFFVSPDALNASVCWDTISVAKVTQILCKKVEIRERKHANGTKFNILNWTDHFL